MADVIQLYSASRKIEAISMRQRNRRVRREGLPAATGITRNGDLVGGVHAVFYGETRCVHCEAVRFGSGECFGCGEEIET